MNKPSILSRRSSAALAALLLGVVPATTRAEHFVNYDSPLIPVGLRPGDSFQLVFVTSNAYNRLSEPTTHPENINYFNALVNTVADSSSIPGMSALNWFAIISTRSADAVPVVVDAVNNAVVSAPVYRVDGVRVASGFDDMWDGAIEAPINVNQNGAITDSGIWSGCGAYAGNGLADGTYALGGGLEGMTGGSAAVGGGWLASGGHTRKGPGTALRYYALSGKLTIAIPPDTDGDGLPDWWEELHFGGPTAANPDEDPDGDGLTNLQEYTLDTRLDPTNPDTDGDGLLDGANITLTNSDPRYAAWATAGIAYFDNDAQRTFRGEATMGTEPLNPDTDGDGLLDGVESNTGVWVGPHDTGTDPLNPDTDGDGLKDGVETNTGIFVSASDTGTNPLVPDSDGDGAGDWYEVYASLTDPNDPNDKPVVPYPLPAPVPGNTGASDKPVKVYILSGQSNMVGFGTRDGSGPGTLATLVTREGKFPNLHDGTGWLLREDVRYRGVVSDGGNGPLGPVYGGNFGPELGFGHVMGWHHDEPVLLIKASQGNRGLFWDMLPPGSPQLVDGDRTYAGHGDSPSSWTTGTEPVPIGWYAGYTYDKFFRDEADMEPTLAWEVGRHFHTSGLHLKHNGVMYKSKSEHTATPESEPGVGAQWPASWDLHTLHNVVDILDNFATEYPQWADQGFEIAGFAWWQGHWDQGNALTAGRYEQNLVRFIETLRAYYENRYPDKIAPNAPFVLATIGFGGWEMAGDALTVANAQLAVDGEAGKYPRFKGNVKTMEARHYWRNSDVSPAGPGYHYHHNAETYLLVGDALGRAMLELLEEEDP